MTASLILMVALTVGLLAAPRAVEAQAVGQVSRVALIASTTPVSEMDENPNTRAFLGALRELGYVEGRNLVLERRSAEGRFNRVPEIVAELVRLKIDVIVAVSNPVIRRASQVTKSVPIVMAVSGTPVENGMIQNLARPGGNVTGLTLDTGPDINEKRVELLREVAPAVSRVAYIDFKAGWDNPFGTAAQTAARALGVTLFLAQQQDSNDYTSVFAAITRDRADAILPADSGPNLGARRQIIAFAAQARLPAIYPFREFVEDGDLISYGVQLPDLFRRAARYVDKVLKGAKPADLPVEQPTKFELVINLKTAKALGLTIPPSVLVRADEVIQ
jgi:ABC-type uncharacterized transport system substrate-binding protein